LYGEQSTDDAGLQVPAPSHVRAGVSVFPLQIAAAHGVPDPAFCVPQVLLEQVRWMHGLPGSGQSLGMLHGTQVPLPLQTLPPFSSQGSPSVARAIPQ
jgi:hypothetical protein